MPGADAHGADPDARSALASGLLAALGSAGIDPPPSLRLLDGRLDHGAKPVDLKAPWDLGVAHELLTAPADQTKRGAWYTPRSVAVDLVAATVDAVGTVVDPACGGGVFLLATADRLVALGADATDVLTCHLVGIDVDPLAVAVSEAALWWWGLSHGTDVIPGHLIVADALVEATWPPARFVVGNPPFLGQLRGGTASTTSDRARLRQRFGDAVGAYTDPAALFLLAAVEAVDAGGAVTLVQPQSVLAARDTTRVRARIGDMAELTSCWFDDGTTFAAAVDTCAPTLRKDGAPGAHRNQAAAWADRLADHHGIPRVDLVGRRSPDARLGDVADIHAGFRDEYYGLVAAVAEGGAGPRLVTSGAIDPLTLHRDRPVAFAKQRWKDPRIDVSKASERAAAWVRRQVSPSLLVASQTRVVECVVDPDGDLVVGVPGLAVIPADVDDLWRLAAIMSAPCVSAWLLRRSVGTGMSGDALRPTAPLLATIPLPTDQAAWNVSAELARQLCANPLAEAHEWLAFARAVDAAFGIADAELVDWWWSRHPAATPTQTNP